MLDVGCSYVSAAGFCEDGSVCIEDDVCQVGECVGGEPKDCDDVDVCMEDICDFVVGCEYGFLEGLCVCVNGVFIDCDDGDVCIKDVCDGMGSCHY